MHSLYLDFPILSFIIIVYPVVLITFVPYRKIWVYVYILNKVSPGVSLPLHLSFPFSTKLYSRVCGQNLTNKRRLEEGLRASETLIADGDDLPIWQLVALFQGGGGGCCGHFVLKIQGHIAKLLLDVTHNFSLSWKK